MILEEPFQLWTFCDSVMSLFFKQLFCSQASWNNPHRISVWNAPLETAAAGWGLGMLLADFREQRELCKHHLETCCKAWCRSLRFSLPLWVSAMCVYGEEASTGDIGDVLLTEETSRCLCSWGAQPHPFPWHVERRFSQQISPVVLEKVLVPLSPHCWPGQGSWWPSSPMQELFGTQEPKWDALEPAILTCPGEAENGSSSFTLFHSPPSSVNHHSGSWDECSFVGQWCCEGPAWKAEISLVAE